MQSPVLYDLHTIDTPIGTLIATVRNNALVALNFSDEAPDTTRSSHPLLLRLETELSEYFAGARRDFTLPLDPQGTPFQKQVWKTLLTIPYGETISYAQEAKIFGNPKAVRALASANGRNPIAILIPCHRVIASGGGLGGYSGGIDKKEFLLELEKKGLSF